MLTLLSHPRCGSHWISCAVELYTQRRRSFGIVKPISLLPDTIPYDNYLFDQTHFIKDQHSDILLLLRNPVDCLFSFSSALNIKDIEPFLIKMCDRMTHRILTYAHKATDIIHYENMLKTPVTEFEKVIKWVNYQWIPDYALECLNKVTKEQLIAHSNMPMFDSRLLAPDYSQRREDFKTKYGPLILEHTSKVSTYFQV